MRPDDERRQQVVREQVRRERIFREAREEFERRQAARQAAQHPKAPALPRQNGHGLK